MQHHHYHHYHHHYYSRLKDNGNAVLRVRARLVESFQIDASWGWERLD